MSREVGKLGGMPQQGDPTPWFEQPNGAPWCHVGEYSKGIVFLQRSQLRSDWGHIYITAIGAIPRQTRGFRALRELDYCIIQAELEASRDVVQELIITATQLESAMQLILDTLDDMLIIINAPIEISS